MRLEHAGFRKLGDKDTPRQLQAAIQSGKTIQLEYVKGDGTNSLRTIKPKLIFEWRGKQYLVATTDDDEAERTFRVDRIKVFKTGTGNQKKATTSKSSK